MFQVPTLLILVLGLTVATCVIAYWSDNLGKNLGKKRISVLGLRPRQTASLISMVSSVGIMLLTLIALMVSFRNFRHALLRYDQVNEDRKIAEQQTKQLQGRLSELNGDLNNLQQQVVSRQKHAQVAEKRARAADKRASLANQRLDQTQIRLTGAQSALSAAQSARAAAQRGEASATRQATQAQARLSQARAHFSQAQARFTQAQYRLKQRQNQLRTVNSQLNIARRDVKQQEVQLEQLKTQYRSAGKKLVSEYERVAKLQANLEKQQEEVRTLEAQREKLQEDVRREEAQVNQYRTIAAQLSQVAKSLAADKLAVSLGQLFAKATIPSGIDAGQARAALRRLLDEAAAEAEKRGARAYTSPVTGITRALHLAPLPVGNEEFNEEEIITHFANYLTGFDVPVSVRLVAARNYAEGETAFQGILQYVPVRRVFGPGEKIVSATIDGSQTDALIFNRLLALLNQGEGVARGRGLQPVPTEENPFLYATGTNERIFDALRRIQSVGGPASVHLEAAEDLSTVEPMRVRFVVNPGGTS